MLKKKKKWKPKINKTVKKKSSFKKHLNGQQTAFKMSGKREASSENLLTPKRYTAIEITVHCIPNKQ